MEEINKKTDSYRKDLEIKKRELKNRVELKEMCLELAKVCKSIIRECEGDWDKGVEIRKRERQEMEEREERMKVREIKEKEWKISRKQLKKCSQNYVRQ